MKIVRLALALFLPLAISFGARANSIGLKTDRVMVRAKLRDAGVSDGYANRLMRVYDERTFQQVLRLNILGILAPPRHGNLVTEEAIQKSVAFIRNNRAVLAEVKKRFGVSPDALAALLWVETRHGVYTGEFHIASAFLHLTLAAEPGTIDGLMDLANRTMDRSRFPANARALVTNRARLRAAWALEQIKVLESLERSKKLPTLKIKGSFAGAFGISQFIPSSYRDWAVSFDPKSKPDLFRVADAIASTANYLRGYGWRANDHQSQVNALLGYNNSLDYAESILELADLVRRRF